MIIVPRFGKRFCETKLEIEIKAHKFLLSWNADSECPPSTLSFLLIKYTSCWIPRKMHAANHIPQKKNFFFYSNFMRWIIFFYSRKFWIYKIDESQLCSQPSNNLFAFSSPCSDAHSRSSRPGNSISPISYPTTVFLCFW